MCRGSGVPGNKTTARGNRGSRMDMMRNLAGLEGRRGRGAEAMEGAEMTGGPDPACRRVIRAALNFQLSPSFPSLCCSPESPERPDIGRVPQLLERALTDLADALAGNAEELADLLEGQGFGPFLEAVVQREDLPLARREVA